MLYRKFGKTEHQISLIGMGGMRFNESDYLSGDLDACAEVMVHAYKKGVNYFDTAPLYCHDKSLEIFARGIARMDRDKIFVTSKASPNNTGEQNGDDILHAIERDCKRLGVDYIDFFHLWCVLSFDMFAEYEKMGILDGLRKAKERGLIRHINISTHASGDDIEKILETGFFEGCLLNYNATNFAFRQKGVEAAARLGIGVITMNPLGGGLIPRNPEFYSFLKDSPDDTVAKAAIRFNASHPALNVVLVGATTTAHIDEACEAIENLQPVSAARLAQMKLHLTENLNNLCTMCGYCDGCPMDIPIPKMMDAYNQYILSGNDPAAMTGRMDGHWQIDYTPAGQCIGCGACEAKCTQKLPIVARLKELYDACEVVFMK